MLCSLLLLLMVSFLTLQVSQNNITMMSSPSPVQQAQTPQSMPPPPQPQPSPQPGQPTSQPNSNVRWATLQLLSTSVHKCEFSDTFNNLTLFPLKWMNFNTNSTGSTGETVLSSLWKQRICVWNLTKAELQTAIMMLTKTTSSYRLMILPGQILAGFILCLFFSSGPAPSPSSFLPSPSPQPSQSPAAARTPQNFSVPSPGPLNTPGKWSESFTAHHGLGCVLVAVIVPGKSVIFGTV